MRCQGCGRVRWMFPAFRPGPQSGSRGRCGRSSSRSPRIRTWTFPAQPRHLPCPPDHRALSCCADSPRGCRPSMAFVSLGSQVCRRLPSDRPSRVGPCLELAVGVNIVDGGPPAGDSHPISPRPCRAYTIGCTGLASLAGEPYVPRRAARAWECPAEPPLCPSVRAARLGTNGWRRPALQGRRLSPAS
jgi:hypothetical protein